MENIKSNRYIRYGLLLMWIIAFVVIMYIDNCVYGSVLNEIVYSIILAGGISVNSQAFFWKKLNKNKLRYFIIIQFIVFLISIVAIFALLPSYTFKDAVNSISDDKKSITDFTIVDKGANYIVDLKNSSNIFVGKAYLIHTIENGEKKIYSFDPLNGDYSELSVYLYHKHKE